MNVPRDRGFLAAHDLAGLSVAHVFGIDQQHCIALLVGQLAYRCPDFLHRRGVFLFGQFLVVTGAPQQISDYLGSLPVPPLVIIALIMVGFLVLGCCLDTIAMILIFVPIVFPAVQALGFDPVWFGVLIVMACEVGLITPPYGMNVFVINGIARDVPLTSTFRGVLPFVSIDILRIVVILLVPGIALWLPSFMG